MKKSLIFGVLFMFLLSLAVVSAATNTNIQVEKVDNGSVIIAELKNPAVFELNIKNTGATDNFEIYSFVGLSFIPKNKIQIPSGETTATIYAYASDVVLKRTGLINFEYQLIGEKTGVFTDTLPIKITSLKEAIKITPKNINYLDSVADIEVNNLENTNLQNMRVRFKSIFFDEEKTISLKPNQKKTVHVTIDNPKLKEVPAGNYVVTADINLAGAKASIDGTVNYLEKQGTSLKTETGGFLLRTTEVTKRNEGNTPTSDRIEIKKNVITRLFTTFSENPLGSDRKGFVITYTWDRDLKPYESWSISATTNYTFPVLILLFIIFIAVMVYVYNRTSLVLEKRVSYVKTSTGDFALKIRLHLKARRHLEGIEITDRIPMTTKLYEGAGMPQKVDAATRRVFWEVDRLNAGEERIFSYIIYSNIRVVGKFELPSASAKYTKDGKHEHVFSNRTYFISDVQRG